MHPLVARIHPSYRTAFFAWVVGRSFFWFSQLRPGNTLLRLAEDTTGGWLLFIDTILRLPSPYGEWTLVVISELLVFAAIVATYRIARRDGVPQTADRATWFFAVSPVFACVPIATAELFSVCLTIIGFAAFLRSYLKLSTGLIAVAMIIRPEIVFLLPAFAAYAYGHEARYAWVVPLAGLASFSAVVIYTVAFGDPTWLASGLAWRDNWAVGALLNDSGWIVFIGSMLGVGIVTHAALVQKRWRAAVGAIPILAVPFIFSSAIGAGFILLLSMPLIATSVAKVSDDPGFERFILGASLATLAIALLT